MRNKKAKSVKKIYPRVFEREEDWPIYKIHKDRAKVIEDLQKITREKLEKAHPDSLVDVIVKTLYLERIRIKEEPWKVDPPNERQFWNRISKRLIKKAVDKESTEADKAVDVMLGKIIHRYAEEIVGTFRIKTYRFTVVFLTALFNRLLNAVGGTSLFNRFRNRQRLYEHLDVQGEIETVRSLMKHGTVVVVPTHFSNLDSPLVGYAMDQIMGMPSFSYGAGLNLLNSGPVAYFINRMGAYRIDRRKKNPIYLETLKSNSELNIMRGVNSLFFPGGTRSRSGEVEKRFKLGLMGTAISAQRKLCAAESDKKVFIVPMVIGYHFVLEAPYLIENHLRKTGKENYLYLKDEGSSIRAWLRYIWRFFNTANDISLTVGKPMDVLGNFVDAEGRSSDKYGNLISVGDYFKGKTGEIVEDIQRETEYTRLLGECIGERYKKENLVLSSHLVAFAVFQFLLHQNPKLDIYGILRLPPNDYIFPFEKIEEVVGQMQQQLIFWEKDEKLKLSKTIHLSPAEILKDGVKRLGVYHKKQPLQFTKKGDIESKSFRTLYYYHNRLDMYGLEQIVTWMTVDIQHFQEGEA